MKKREMMLATISLTACVIASSVGYGCGKTEESVDDISVPSIEEQVSEAPSETVKLEPPKVVSYNEKVSVAVGKSLTLEKLKIVLSTEDDVDYKIPTKKYEKVGDYTEKVKITDKVSKLSTEIEVKVEVVDTKAPRIKGVHDITVTEGDPIDLLSGVSAKDNYDGNLTKKIKVSSYDAGVLDKEQTITYKVTDHAGNTTKKKAKLLIKSNPVEALDKIVYATTALNVRDSSSADGNAIGQFGYAGEIHVIGRDKNTGWYKVEYNGGTGWVSSDYTSDTKPVVEVPKQTVTQSTQTNTDCDCAQANCNCDCQATPADCQADCECNCNCDCDCQPADCQAPADCSTNCELIEETDCDCGTFDCATDGFCSW